MDDHRPSAESKPWYKDPKRLLLVILFWPYVLVWYTWARAKWSTPVKGLVTAAVALPVLIVAASAGSSEPTKQAASTPTPQVLPAATTTALAKPAKTPTPTPTPKVDTSDLDATVRKSQVAIELTNNEDKNWQSCSLKLNDKLFGGGYSKELNLAAKGVVVVSFSEFTKGDGTRFNVDQTEPQSLFIACNTPDRRSAYYGLK